MKRHAAILLLLAFGASAQAEDIRSEVVDARLSLAENSETLLPPFEVRRRTLIADITQLTFLVRVGPQEQDVLRIHRVVREVHGRPIIAEQGVFLTHGNLFGFEETFLAGYLSTSAPASQSFAVFLASHGVDVWGVDLRWHQVSGDTTDFAFMSSWNIESDVRDVRLAMLIARSLRSATGSGFSKLHLGGWSSGGIINYALADKESEMSPLFRQAKTLIPMDTMYKVDPAYPEIIGHACSRYEAYRALVDAGTFQSDEGAQVAALAGLAAIDPQGPSPAIPGMTNREAILFLVGVFPDPNPLVPFFHQLAVELDDTGIPRELRFSDEPFMIDFLLSPAPFVSLGQRVDFEQIFCDQIPSVHSDNLDEISVPVLYVGAEGGFGSYGTFTQSLFASTDVTNLVVSLASSGERAFDFAHSELFIGREAEDLVWRPVLDWILSR